MCYIKMQHFCLCLFIVLFIQQSWFFEKNTILSAMIQEELEHLSSASTLCPILGSIMILWMSQSAALEKICVTENILIVHHSVRSYMTSSAFQIFASCLLFKCHCKVILIEILGIKAFSLF